MEDLRSYTSRTNAAKSTGPSTPEGMARSARNAEKHGAFSRAIVLQHEDPAAFAEHRDHYYRRFRPADPTEADLVDQMVAATWRLRRFTAVETAALDHAVDAQRARLEASHPYLDDHTRLHFAFDKLHGDGPALANYQRFQTAQLRLYDRAYRNLRSLRAIEKCENEATFSPAESSQSD